MGAREVELGEIPIVSHDLDDKQALFFLLTSPRIGLDITQ